MLPDIDIARYRKHRDLAARLADAKQDYDYWCRHADHDRPTISYIDRSRTRVIRRQTREEFLGPYRKALHQAELEYKANLYDADQIRRTSSALMERAIQEHEARRNGVPMAS